MREGNWAKLPFAKTSGTVTGNRANKLAKGPVIIYRLEGGGGTKGGNSRNLQPKRGIIENFGRIQRGDHSNLLGK